jgi:hypothetical protein
VTEPDIVTLSLLLPVLVQVIAPILYEDPDDKTWEDIVDEAMWRTVRAPAASQETFKVVTMTAEPSAAQQAVQSWLAEEHEAVASDKKIGLTSYMRLAAIGLPVLLWHVEEARLKASGALIPKTRAAQEDWLRAMGFQVDPAASAVEHRYSDSVLGLLRLSVSDCLSLSAGPCFGTRSQRSITTSAPGTAVGCCSTVSRRAWALTSRHSARWTARTQRL